MTLRRAAAALPLAFSVAVVAHVVGFGTDHAPGGGHAAALLASLVAALLACVAWAFATGFTGRSTYRSIATSGSSGNGGIARVASTGLLALGGTLSFLGMELAEGHLEAAPGTFLALLALVPVATLVAIFSRRIATTASRAGFAAASASLRLPRLSVSFSTRRPATAFARPGRSGARATRGRAPPHNA